MDVTRWEVHRAIKRTRKLSLLINADLIFSKQLGRVSLIHTTSLSNNINVQLIPIVLVSGCLSKRVIRKIKAR